ncbi:MAG: 16S rRNA (guanine(527)-N(7))-methyltransferase RsmG [Bacillota bacterium]|nr:16S rRNA (guanine(527)-N(7))-methyltransferase RsmG [Bacillota bacterium]
MTFEQLNQKLTELEILLPSETIEKFKIYSSLLCEWNEKINLTSILNEEEIVEKHFLDCLLPGQVFAFSKRTNLCDLGTGAGFPGMVLAIAYPNLKVTLVDSTAKKFKFLEEVKSACNVKNVSFHIGRGEEMKSFKEHFDIVTARSFSALPNILELGLPLCKIGGTLVAYKGEKGKEELKGSERALDKLGGRLLNLQEASLPSGDKRINLLFKKEKKSPSRYPRTWGEIVAHPL